MHSCDMLQCPRKTCANWRAFYQCAWQFASVKGCCELGEEPLFEAGPVGGQGACACGNDVSKGR
eukprot:scaffold165869_cov23-Tisochrysis_lutea.AAC.1